MPRVLAALVTVRDAAMRCELCGSCAVFDAARLGGRILLSRIDSGDPVGSEMSRRYCELGRTGLCSSRSDSKHATLGSRVLLSWMPGGSLFAHSLQSLSPSC